MAADWGWFIIGLATWDGYWLLIKISGLNKVTSQDQNVSSQSSDWRLM